MFISFIYLYLALDAGCGPGRTALELSRVFSHVEAYDFSQGFIDMLKMEVANREIKNLVAYQGDSHRQKDVCQVNQFDLIHGCNLIDRLHSPDKWILQSKVWLSMLNFCIFCSTILPS
jgi:SAM-dependent methyltransferase